MTLYSPRPTQPLPLTGQRIPASPELFGTLVMEITTPDGLAQVPELPGWVLRAWPVARLGDATLEAHPAYPHLCGEHLRLDLAQRGVQVLGPMRERR